MVAFEISRSLLRRLAASAVLLIAASFSHARVHADTHFEGSFDYWVPDGPNPMVSGSFTDSLTWGDPGNFGVGPSSVSYFDYSISTDLVLSGQPFRLGRVRYFNGTIIVGTGISAATLFLDSWSDDDDLDATGPFPLHMITETTPNVGTPLQNADYLFFVSYVHNPYVPQFFNVFEGGNASAEIIATLEILPDLLRDDRQAQRNPYALHVLGFANVQGDGFLTFEPIPEPATGMLLLSAVAAGLVGVRRRSPPAKVILPTIPARRSARCNPVV
jgi:hypothetical protein